MKQFSRWKTDATWLAFVASVARKYQGQLDTRDIASKVGVTEADVYNALTLISDTNAFAREANNVRPFPRPRAA